MFKAILEILIIRKKKLAIVFICTNLSNTHKQHVINSTNNVENICYVL